MFLEFIRAIVVKRLLFFISGYKFIPFYLLVIKLYLIFVV